MRAVNLRPLATFCLSFFLFSIIVSAEAWNKLPAAAALALLSAFLFFIFEKLGRNYYVRTAAIIVLALCASILFTLFFIDRPMEKYSEYEGEHTVSGKICEIVWSTSYGSKYVAELRSIDGEEVSFRVSLEGGEMLRRGDTFKAQITLGELTSHEEFDSRRYFINKGAYLAASASELDYTGKDPDFTDRLYEINQELSAKLVIMMGKENGGIAASMLLGNRDYLSEDFSDAVNKLGLSHIIALSGMHLTVLCVMLSIVLSNFGAKASRLCSIPIVAAYIMLTGFFASIVRAGIMLACCNLISLTGKSTDSPTNLGISAMLITVFDPASVCDIGFQLSVFAMLGVYASLKFMGEDKLEFDNPKTKVVKNALLPFAMSIFATASTMIPVIFYFGYITPAAIIASVPFSFAGDMILWFSPFALIFGGIPFVGDVFCNLCSFPCTEFNKLAVLFGSSNKLTVEVSEGPQLWCAVLFSVVFMMIFVMDTKKMRRSFAIISAAFLLMFAGITGYVTYKEYNSVILTPVETASGEGMVVSGRDKSIAVDISNGSSKMYRYISDAALDMRLDYIDALIIVNPHSAHAYYIEELTDKFRIGTVYMPDEDASHYVASAMNEDINIEYYVQGESFDMEMFKLFTYEDVYLSRSKVPVVRLAIQTEDKSLFYLGAAAEEAGIFPDASDYLWIGGYGPKNKNQMTFSPTSDELMISEKTADYYPVSATKTTDQSAVLLEP